MHDVNNFGTLTFLGSNGDSDISLYRWRLDSLASPLLTKTLEAGKIYPFTLDIAETT